MKPNVLSIERLSKRFPPNIVALEEANIVVRRGEVHCLLGANGAGKSTFLKLIAGALSPSGGEIRIDGQPVHFRAPAEAAGAGISMIYQELDLVPQLTVAENLFLGHPPSRFGFLDKRRRRAGAREALARVGATFAPEERVGSLSIANQQLTAIARSLTREAKVIIMDEPSAALNETELKAVFRVIRELTAQGVAILYVSHRLGELREIGDRVTVLRGGRTIETFDVEGTPDSALVEAILGRERAFVERRERAPVTGEVVLKVDRLTAAQGLDVRNFELRRGEIAGLTGLNGSGRTSFLKALFGADTHEAQMSLYGKPYKARTPRDAIAAGLGLVPESRKTEGLILDAPIYRNATLPAMQGQFLARHRLLKAKTVPVLKQLSTKYGSPEQKVIQLSGGNQQKIVLAKWIIKGAKLLLLDEWLAGLNPTELRTGIKLIDELRHEGRTIIMVEHVMDAIRELCDRCVVMNGGKLIAEGAVAEVLANPEVVRAYLGDEHA